jgi:RHS repeat-associated protein
VTQRGDVAPGTGHSASHEALAFGALPLRRDTRHLARVPPAFVLAALTVLLSSGAARAQETVEYYGADAVGSVRVVFDQSGGVVARTEYLPFGEEAFAPGPVPKERFTSQERDGEAGMDYFKALMRQPRVGRFSTQDPVAGVPRQPQTFNKYGYALDNPLSYTDPRGTTPYKLVCMTVESGAAANTGTGDYKVDFHGGVTLSTVCRYVADPTIQEPTWPTPFIPGAPSASTGPASTGPGGTPQTNQPVLEKPGARKKSKQTALDIAHCMVGQLVDNAFGDDDKIAVTTLVHVGAVLAARKAAGEFVGLLLPGPGWAYTTVAVGYDAIQVASAYATCKEK